MKDLSAHIMDIVQNSVRAEARRIEIEIREELKDDSLSIGIKDDGCGMDKETLEKVTDPFFTSRTVRKVGLGIPLLLQNAERTGGKFSIASEKGKGTTVSVVFIHSHLDRPPLGDMASTIGLLAVANPGVHFLYTHTTPDGEYRFDTEEINRILDGVPLSHPDILPALMEMIREGLKAIKADRKEKTNI